MRLFVVSVILEVFFLACVLTIPAAFVHAKPRTSVKNVLVREENPRGTKSKLILPYVLSTDSMGFTAGVGAAAKGYGQEQLLLGATVFGSVDSAVGGFLGMWDYRPSWTERFFFSAQGMAGHYPRQRAYSATSFEPGRPPAGSNESDKDDFVEDPGYDNWTDFQLEYVLPLGSARCDALFDYRLKGGLLISDPVGGKQWNPLESGVSTLLLRQFNRFRSFETDSGNLDATTHPFELAISYNNTDFHTNPSYGSNQYLGVTHDFGWLESPDSWTFIEFEASKYFSLGDSDWAKQRIIALNFWTGDTPTWEESINDDGNIVVSHRPPFYEGATLGGFFRMRGYPVDRFNDRSVVYTTAEYRYTLRSNPIGGVNWLRFLQSDWLQLVGFIEGGRVANNYNLSVLLQDWKVDGGFGLRGMFAGGVVRLDVGISEESTNAWVMFGHPF